MQGLYQVEGGVADCLLNDSYQPMIETAEPELLSE